MRGSSAWHRDPETSAGTLWDIDEDTGMPTAATRPTVTTDTGDLHRVVVALRGDGSAATMGTYKFRTLPPAHEYPYEYCDILTGIPRLEAP